MAKQPKKHDPGDHTRTIDRSLWGPAGQDAPSGPGSWFDSVITFDPDQLGPVVSRLMTKARAAGLADYTLTIEGGLFVVYVYDQWQLRRDGKERQR